jgi:hypothetical protein
VAAAGLLAAGCSTYAGRHQLQWSSLQQVWRAEASQVRVRNAQSRVFDTSDRLRTVEAVVATFQDLGFQLELLDETLGIVSGRKFTGLEKPAVGFDPTYVLYDPEGLVVFSRTYRTWGPFWHRSDLVRLTVTVRARNEKQLVVRAAAQFHLRPIEDPGPYQEFFRTLEQAMFGERHAGGPSRAAPSGAPLASVR